MTKRVLSHILLSTRVNIFLCLVLLSSINLLGAIEIEKKTPKYLISPYVEIISGSCFVIKIDYFRYYNVSEGLEDTYYVQGRSSGGVAFMRSENQTTYENFTIDIDKNKGKMGRFSENKLFKISAGSKKVPLEIGNRIMGFLNDETDGNTAYDNRKGTIILGYIQRLCFDVNQGQILSEVESVYQGKLVDDEDWIAQFDNLMTLFNTYQSSYLLVVGTASTTYAGNANAATESNIDLAGRRAAAGVNFFIDKFNDNISNNLRGSASYNSSSNTVSLSGDGTERIIARNGGITSTDIVDDDFYSDQCIYFKLLI